MFHNIMVAFDESPEAGQALTTAIELSKSLGAELDVVTILEPLPVDFSFSTLVAPDINWSDKQLARCAALQMDAKQVAETAGIAFRTDLVSGDEATSIIGCAMEYGADLLVFGMRKHKLLIGHTTHDIAEHAPCPVLGVR